MEGNWIPRFTVIMHQEEKPFKDHNIFEKQINL